MTSYESLFMSTKLQRVACDPAFILPGIALPAKADLGQWLLMSRHGECHEISAALGQGVDDLAAIRTPEQSVDEVNRRNIGKRVTPAPGGAQGTVVVDIPERSSALIFAQRARRRQVAKSEP